MLPLHFRCQCVFGLSYGQRNWRESVRLNRGYDQITFEKSRLHSLRDKAIAKVSVTASQTVLLTAKQTQKKRRERKKKEEKKNFVTQA